MHIRLTLSMQTVAGKSVTPAVSEQSISDAKYLYDIDEEKALSKPSFVKDGEASVEPTTEEDQCTQQAQEIHPASMSKNLVSPKSKGKGHLPTPQTAKTVVVHTKKLSKLLMDSDDQQGPASWADYSLGNILFFIIIYFPLI